MVVIVWDFLWVSGIFGFEEVATAFKVAAGDGEYQGPCL